jgi:carboxypeptidase T
MKSCLINNKIIIFLLCLSLLSGIIPIGNANDNNLNYQLQTSNAYDYFTYPEMTSLLQNQSQNHSDIMSLTSIGKTYEQRDIWMVKLSDNVDQDEDEPGVLLMGAHHGDEKPSFEVLIYFINYVLDCYEKENTDDDGDGLVNEDIIDGYDNDGDGLVDEDPSEDRVRDVLENTQIYLIPMVNPDGVEYNWRKNRAPNYGADGKSDTMTSYGVDLNRNYGYMWNIVYLFPENYFLEYITDENTWVYRGEEPFCENETRAVKSFVETHEISISLSYHDYGEFMLFPWMHTSRKTPHEMLFRSIGENMSKINKYDLKIYGQYGEREYIIPRFQGTPGSSENWLYGEHGILSFTMELCKRRPEQYSPRVLDACWKHVGVNLYVCERAQTVEEEKKECELTGIYNILFDKFYEKIFNFPIHFS